MSKQKVFTPDDLAWGDKQTDYTEYDFNWNHELNMPNRIVDAMTPEQVVNIKRLRVLVKSGCATSEEITEYTRIMMAETW